MDEHRWWALCLACSNFYSINKMSDHEKSEANAYYQYQIHNIYNKDKHVNPHDIAGVPALTAMQVLELEKKKVKSRVDNEIYLREHPELDTMVQVFLFKVLEDKPANILSYAGAFFDQPKLQEIVEIQRKYYLEKKAKR